MLDGIAELDIQIAKLSARMSKLGQKRVKIIHNHIRQCKHENIVSSENDNYYPWRSDTTISCLNCGVTVHANGCGAFHSNVLSFRDSRLVTSKPGETIKREFILGHELMECVQYPRRFEEPYRRRLIACTPWKYSEVMKGDKKHYYCLHTDPFKNHDDWWAYHRPNDD